MPPLLSMPSADAPFALGPWQIDPVANDVRAGDAAAVRLEPKTMGVLVTLAARAGETVTRAEIEAAVWPDVVVTEASLTRCVSQIRQALGDDPRAPAFIETVPTVGYRLLVAPGPVATRAPTAPSPRRRRIWMAGVVVLLGLAAAAWLGMRRTAPVEVTYRVEATGQPGVLAVRYTRPGGDTTESIRAFPAVRTVRVGASGGRRYELRAVGTARRAEVQLAVRAVQGRRVLARGWAMGRVDRPGPEEIAVHTHVDLPLPPE